MGLRGGTTALDGLTTRLFGGGGGGPTIPSDISGLQFWFKAPIAGATNGNPITTWPDSSGNARTATPTATGLTYITNVINSLAVVSNTGGDYATFSSASLSTSHTAFVVIRILGGFTDSVIVGGDATGKYMPYLDTSSIYYRPVSTDSFVSVAHGGVSSNTSYLFEIVRNNTAVSFYKNGAQLSTTQTLGANTALAADRIFASGSFTTGAIEIAEVFVYDSALSDSNRQAMETYVSTRFAFF